MGRKAKVSAPGSENPAGSAPGTGESALSAHGAGGDAGSAHGGGLVRDASAATGPPVDCRTVALTIG
ncbi:hypothetical protein R0K17_31115, partial [Planococcus sp. SIMBA_143]